MPAEAAVLVVSQTDLLQTTACLREEGIRALGVPDEVAVAEILRQGYRPSVLVVDYPASWGSEGSFLSLIRAYHASARVIAVIARAEPVLERSLVTEGYDDVCVRPMSRHVLVEKVRRLLSLDARG